MNDDFCESVAGVKLFCFFFVNERKNKLVTFTRSYVHQRYMQQYLRTENFPSFSVIKVIVTATRVVSPGFTVGSTMVVDAHVSSRRPPCLSRHYGVLRGSKGLGHRVCFVFFPTEAPSDFRETM